MTFPESARQTLNEIIIRFFMNEKLEQFTRNKLCGYRLLQYNIYYIVTIKTTLLAQKNLLPIIMLPLLKLKLQKPGLKASLTPQKPSREGPS